MLQRPTQCGRDRSPLPRSAGQTVGLVADLEDFEVVRGVVAAIAIAVVGDRVRPSLPKNGYRLSALQAKGKVRGLEVA